MKFPPFEIWLALKFWRERYEEAIRERELWKVKYQKLLKKTRQRKLK